MRAIWRFLKSVFARLPIYGELVSVRSDSRKDAITELLVTTVFSLLPIWFFPLLMSFTDQPILEAVRSCVERGELYLYSAALLGPLIYSVSKRYGVNDDVADVSESERRGSPKIVSFRFPYKGLFSVIAILVCGVAAGVFALVRLSIDGLLVPDLNEEAVLWASVILYVFTLSCMFCVLVYRLELEDIPNRFGDDTKELLDQWRDRN